MGGVVQAAPVKAVQAWFHRSRRQQQQLLDTTLLGVGRKSCTFSAPIDCCVQNYLSIWAVCRSQDDRRCPELLWKGHAFMHLEMRRAWVLLLYCVAAGWPIQGVLKRKKNYRKSDVSVTIVKENIKICISHCCTTDHRECHHICISMEV